MLVKADGLIEKTTKLAEGEVEFVVSTNAWDTHGERINVDGIMLKDFKKNPVVLWGHDGFSLPIAKASKVWKENGKLLARAKFYLKDEFPNKVYQYIIDGMLNAVSIGGMVEEWGEDGVTVSKMNMKEFSVVSVPANPEALVVNKKMNGNDKAELRALANAYARKCLDTDNASLAKDIETLETLVATLKEVAFSETQDGSAKSVRVVLKQAQTVDSQAEKVIRKIKLKEIINE